MSPFMSSMPPAGLIEMPPESKQTPLPMKATGLALPASLPRAVPAHHDDAAFLARALADGQQRAHADFLQLLLVEDLDLDAELLQLLRAAGELLRVEHVRRLVDQGAGQHHPFARSPRGRGGPCRPPGIGHGDDDARPRRPPRRRASLSCRFRTRRRAASCRARGRPPPPRRCAGRRVPRGTERRRTCSCPPGPGRRRRGRRNPSRRARRPADAHHDQTRRLEPGGSEDRQAAGRLALEALRRNGPRDRVGGGLADHLVHARRKREVVSHEDDEGAGRGQARGRKGNFQTL